MTNRTRTPIRHVNGHPTVRIRISQQPPAGSFGRATWLDDEEIQDAPRIGPDEPEFWLVVAFLAICWVFLACMLVGAFALLRGALRLIGVIG